MLKIQSGARWPLRISLVVAFALFIPGCHRQSKLSDDNDVLYRRARQNIADRRFMQAIRVLGDVGLITPISDELDPKIKLALADAHFYQPGTVNVVEAQSRYEQFISFYPTHDSAFYAKFQVGACLLRQAESPENDQEYSVRATRHFQQMVAELPDENPWRRAAQTMLIKAQENLAEHEWLVAKYYSDHEKWAGAIERLTRLVDSYSGSARREEAFLSLARALVAAGDLDGASAAIERMLREYPDGPWAATAQVLRDEITSERVSQGSRAPLGDGAAGASF